MSQYGTKRGQGQKQRQTGSMSPMATFFKEGAVEDDFVPQTGDPSLTHMPWAGPNQDWQYGQVPTEKEYAARDRRTYIRMDSTASPSVSMCHECGTAVQMRCGCCRHKIGHAEPKRAGNRKEQVRSTKNFYQKRFRRMESMAALAFEAEKLGRHLAVAASMFAAGYVAGSMSSKQEKEEEEDDDEYEEEDQTG